LVVALLVALLGGYQVMRPTEAEAYCPDNPNLTCEEAHQVIFGWICYFACTPADWFCCDWE